MIQIAHIIRQLVENGIKEIKDITIINETIDKFTENLSIKNQNIEDYIIKKNITMDEIANIIKYSQQNEYLN